MEGYNFFATDGGQSTEAKQPTADDDWGIRTWNLGEHQEKAPDFGWDMVQTGLNNIEDDAPGLADALKDAKNIAETFTVGGYECAVCGLNHSHSDTKHDIRDIFGVTEEFVEGMKFSPFCHCGVSELARLVMHFNDIEVVMFENQAQYEGIRELDTTTVRNVYRATREVTVEDADRDFDMDIDGPNNSTLNVTQAIEWERRRSGSRFSPVPADLKPELVTFFDKVNRIREAARNAPIPSDTEQSLNESLGEL